MIKDVLISMLLHQIERKYKLPCCSFNPVAKSAPVGAFATCARIHPIQTNFVTLFTAPSSKLNLQQLLQPYNPRNAYYISVACFPDTGAEYSEDLLPTSHLPPMQRTSSIYSE